MNDKSYLPVSLINQVDKLYYTFSSYVLVSASSWSRNIDMLNLKKLDDTFSHGNKKVLEYFEVLVEFFFAFLT